MPRSPNEFKQLSASEFERALSSPRTVAIHCWASWNSHDYDFAEQLSLTATRFSSTIDFYGLDVEKESNVVLVSHWAILNVPAIVAFRSRKFLGAVWMELETIERFTTRVENFLTEAIGQAIHPK